MNKFYIFTSLFVCCLSYNYNERAYYHPRYAANRLSGVSTPFGRTLFGRKPFETTLFGRISFGRLPFGRKPFGRTLFGRTSFRKRPFQHRLQMRLYRGKYYRNRTDYKPLAAWVRQNKLPEVRTEMPEVRTEIPKHPNYSLSDFGFIKNGQNNASAVTDTNKWLWIARVVPTNSHPAPMICTAACITWRIFVTAAICIHKVKLVYTRVLHQGHELPPIAFVLPSNQTKEMFDDIGIIVVDYHTYIGHWEAVHVHQKMMNFGRPDDQFLWNASPEPWHKATAIGYVGTLVNEYDPNQQLVETVQLYELDVKYSNFLCNYFFNNNTSNDAYFVPCYSPCDLMEHYQNLPKCYTYLSGLGHILVWNETVGGQEKLIGVATWGGYYTRKSGTDNPPLPIGLSIANSPTFKEDFDCAMKIRDLRNDTGRFVTLCNVRK